MFSSSIYRLCPCVRCIFHIFVVKSSHRKGKCLKIVLPYSQGFFYLFTKVFSFQRAISHHLFLNREGRWGTTDDFTTSFLHFSLFSTTVDSLMLSSHLVLLSVCLVFFPLSRCLSRCIWPDLKNGRHDHTTSREGIYK